MIKIKSISVALFITILGLITSCTLYHESGKGPEISSDGFEWQTSGPLELLSLLKDKGHGVCPTYMVHGVTGGWVKEEHLAGLISLLGSDEPCANVCRTISSFRDCNTSTVGKEAAYLIEGFRRGEYPPDLNSGRARFNNDEIRRWWQDYKSDTSSIPE